MNTSKVLAKNIDINEIYDVLSELPKIRQTAKTKLNENSSRSSILFKIHVKDIDFTFNIIDLAGKEIQIDDRKTMNKGIF
jgi:hypothetical protein